MTQVYRILMMDLNQIPFCIVDLLVETECDFIGADCFDISDTPA